MKRQKPSFFSSHHNIDPPCNFQCQDFKIIRQTHSKPLLHHHQTGLKSHYKTLQYESVPSVPSSSKTFIYPPLYFENFPISVSVESLRQSFGKFGKVDDVYVSKKTTKFGRRFGFLKITSSLQKQELLSHLNGIWFGYYKLRVNLARFLRKPLQPKYLTSIENVEKNVNKGQTDQCTRKAKRDSRSYAAVVSQGLRSKEERHLESFLDDKQKVSGKQPAQSVNISPSQQARKTRNRPKRKKRKVSQKAKAKVIYEPEVADMEWPKRCAVGVAKYPENITGIHDAMLMEGISDCQVKIMGGRMVLLVFSTREEMLGFIEGRRDWLDRWFETVREWQPTDVSYERFTWIRCHGVPLHAWNTKFFSLMGSLVGKFITEDNNTSAKGRLDVARLFITTPYKSLINEKHQVQIGENVFHIHFIEEPTLEIFPMTNDRAVGKTKCPDSWHPDYYDTSDLSRNESFGGNQDEDNSEHLKSNQKDSFGDDVEKQARLDETVPNHLFRQASSTELFGEDERFDAMHEEFNVCSLGTLRNSKIVSNKFEEYMLGIFKKSADCVVQYDSSLPSLDVDTFQSNGGSYLEKDFADQREINMCDNDTDINGEDFATEDSVDISDKRASQTPFTQSEESLHMAIIPYVPPFLASPVARQGPFLSPTSRDINEKQDDEPFVFKAIPSHPTGERRTFRNFIRSIADPTGALIELQKGTTHKKKVKGKTKERGRSSLWHRKQNESGAVQLDNSISKLDCIINSNKVISDQLAPKIRSRENVTTSMRVEAKIAWQAGKRMCLGAKPSELIWRRLEV